MNKLFSIAVVCLSLSACAALGTNSMGAGNNSTANNNAASTSQTQSFIQAVEAKRGSALGLAEKVQLQGLVGATKAGINGVQNNFLNSLGQRVGLNGPVLAALFPTAGAPISESAAVTKVEQALGSRLSQADASAVKAATALRNNTGDSLKTGLSKRIGGLVGLDGAMIEALLPMLGF
jgi:hypothetical protein